MGSSFGERCQKTVSLNIYELFFIDCFSALLDFVTEFAAFFDHSVDSHEMEEQLVGVPSSSDSANADRQGQEWIHGTDRGDPCLVRRAMDRDSFQKNWNRLSLPLFH